MVEALLLSVREPQLERCLESIRNQTVPFSNVTHIADVCPFSEAYNRGLSLVKDKWFMRVDGDAIPALNAVEKVTQKIEENKNEKVIGHLFPLLDTFLGYRWTGIGTLRTDVLRTVPFRDRLDCERIMSKKLARRGWEMVGYEEYLGTNFDSPDERQVFERFFTSALKYSGDAVRKLHNDLRNLFIKTGNPLYQLAIKAMEFGGKKHGMYPGSQNISFEREMYEEFKNDFART